MCLCEPGGCIWGGWLWLGAGAGTGCELAGGGGGSWAFVSSHLLTSMVLHMRPASCTHLNRALLSLVAVAGNWVMLFKKSCLENSTLAAVTQSTIRNESLQPAGFQHGHFLVSKDLGHKLSSSPSPLSRTAQAIRQGLGETCSFCCDLVSLSGTCDNTGYE